jgi:hypothetical protein
MRRNESTPTPAATRMAADAMATIGTVELTPVAIRDRLCTVTGPKPARGIEYAMVATANETGQMIIDGASGTCARFDSELCKALPHRE